MSFSSKQKIIQIKKDLSTPYESGGFMVDTPHFEVARQLHIDRFYYVKQYFQNVRFSKKIAALILRKLKDMGINFSDLTLVGTSDFFEMALAETVSLMKKGQPDDAKVNYALINNTKGKKSFLFSPVLYSNILIVLPVTVTFSTAFDIIKVIDDYGKQNGIRFQILKQLLSIFIVIDLEVEKREFTLDFSEPAISKDAPSSVIKLLYKNFGWASIENGRIKFAQHEIYQGFSAEFIVPLQARLHAAESCPNCFPDDIEKAKPLYPTKNTHDTPDLILDIPRFRNEKGLFSTEDFNLVFDINKRPTGHLFGHLNLDQNSFLHYIERDIFYDNNRDAILDHFENSIQTVFPHWEDTQEAVLFITPSHQKTSRIFEDLVNLKIFSNKDVTIARTNPYSEFIENFLNSIHQPLSSFGKIFFFDYMLSGGKTFKIISDYLKSAQEFSGEKETKGKIFGFDAVFTVVDRTTQYSKEEILRKLSSEFRQEPHPDWRFISYFKLNLPLMDAAYSGNPIEEKNRKLNRLFFDSHTDLLKIAFWNKLKAGEPLDLTGLRNKNNNDYSEADRERYLNKLYASHLISNRLAEVYIHVADPSMISFSEGDFDQLIQKVSADIEQRSPAYRNTEIARDLVLKTLTHSPFKYYQYIYLASFKYINQKLACLVSEILSGKRKMTTDEEWRNFHFLIKRSVEVQSNYILSEHFFRCLKAVFESSPKVDLKGMIRFYKELIYKNPERSIRFEELLNDPSYLPNAIANNGTLLEVAFRDRFYLLGRILKSENIFLFKELLNLFLNTSDHGLAAGQLDDLIEEKYFSLKADLSNKTISNVLEIMKRSKFNPEKQLLQSGKKVLKTMLKTAYLLKHSKSTGEGFDLEMHKILKNIVSIVTEDSVSYSFCIEYKENGMMSSTSENFASNIFTISSKKSDENRLLQISRDGLIYKMLYGLYDTSDDLQTFITVVKNENGQYVSFSDSYTTTGTNGQDRVPLEIHDSFNNDISHNGSGVVERDTQMALLFRFANFDSMGKHKGQAVLIVSTTRPATTENLVTFLDIERVRLLLCIKEQLLTFLAKHFENDAFIEVLENRKVLSFKNAMNHMLKGYFNAINSLLQNPELTIEDVELLRFLNLKINTHIRSVDYRPQSNNPGFLNRRITVGVKQLKDLFHLVMRVPGLSRLDIHEYELEEPNFSSFVCHPVIWEQIIPELLINMRRNGCEVQNKDKLFRIMLEGNTMIFSNRFNPEMILGDPTEIKPGGGKEMCKKLIELLRLPEMKSKVGDDAIYTTVLFLKDN